MTAALITAMAALTIGSAQSDAGQEEAQAGPAPVAEAEQPQNPYGRYGEEPESFGRMLARTFVVLGIVVAAAYLSLNFGLRRMMGARSGSPGGRVVSVLERVTMEPKRGLLVVKAAGEYLLLGSSEGGVSFLSKLDAAEVERIIAQHREKAGAKALPLLRKLFGPKEGSGS